MDGERQNKKCPHCGEEILIEAKKCKHCGEWLELEHKIEMEQATTRAVSEGIAVNQLQKKAGCLGIVGVIMLFTLIGTWNDRMNRGFRWFGLFLLVMLVVFLYRSRRLVKNRTGK